VLSHQAIQAANPGLPGSFAVKSMYYGSGNDKLRREYRDSVTLKTPTVDGSAFVSLTGDAAKAHDKLWGLTMKKMPLTDASGIRMAPVPFRSCSSCTAITIPRISPTPATSTSASNWHRTVSSWCRSTRTSSTACRVRTTAEGGCCSSISNAGRNGTTSVGGPFQGKVDMHNIGLMGHSRGGEAIAHAFTFNHLKYYPDDAKVKLDFNFDIKALVAIAPVDGQYKPASVFEPLENVNYMVIHGSHDATCRRSAACASSSDSSSPTASRTSNRRGTCTAPITGSGIPSGTTRTTVRAAVARSTCAG